MLQVQKRIRRKPQTAKYISWVYTQNMQGLLSDQEQGTGFHQEFGICQLSVLRLHQASIGHAIVDADLVPELGLQKTNSALRIKHYPEAAPPCLLTNAKWPERFEILEEKLQRLTRFSDGAFRAKQPLQP